MNFAPTPPSTPFDFYEQFHATHPGYNTPQPTGIAVSDLDGDGYPDVVFSSYSEQAIYLFQNNSVNIPLNHRKLSGTTFQLPVQIGVPLRVVIGNAKPQLGIRCIAAGVLRPNSHPDIIVGTTDGQLIVLRNNIPKPVPMGYQISQSDFTPHDFTPIFDANTSAMVPLFGAFQKIIAKDIDGDNRCEVIVAGDCAQLCVFKDLFDSPPPTPWTTSQVPPPAYRQFLDMVVGNLVNSGSQLDIAVLSWDNGTPPLGVSLPPSRLSSIRVYINTAQPGSQTPSFTQSSSDFIVTDDTNTAYWPGDVLHPAAMAIGDLNRDGKPDLALANVVRGSATCPGPYPAVFLIENSNLQMGNSGALPLEIATLGSGSDSVMIATSGATLGGGGPSTPDCIAIMDLDADGNNDILVSGGIIGSYISAVTFLKNITPMGGELSAGNFIAGGNFCATQGRPGHIAFADIDGDNAPEAIVRDFGGVGFAVLHNNVPSLPSSESVGFQIVAPNYLTFNIGTDGGTILLEINGKWIKIGPIGPMGPGDGVATGELPVSVILNRLGMAMGEIGSILAKFNGNRNTQAELVAHLNKSIPQILAKF